MELLTREQAAERLGISVSTLDSERVAGNLEYIQRKRYGKVWITDDAITKKHPGNYRGAKRLDYYASCCRRASCKTFEQLMPSLSALVAIHAGIDTFFLTALVSVRER